jgi:glycosyltransferase involved in cell wall biosynthesis
VDGRIKAVTDYIGEEGGFTTRVLLVVPYSLNAVHGNAVRVRSMMTFTEGVSYVPITFDLPWTRGKTVAIPWRTVAASAYERLVNHAPILNLLVAENPPPSVMEKVAVHAGGAHILQAENLWAMGVTAGSGLPKVATLHDVYSHRTRELLEHFGASPQKQLEVYERVRRLEEKLLPQFDACVFVSRRDLEEYRAQIGAAYKAHVVPNGVDTRRFRPIPPDKVDPRRFGLPPQGTVLFTGSDMYQNRDAVDRLLEVASTFRDGRTRFVVAGTVSAYAGRRANALGVPLTTLGYVERLEEVYALADVYYAPLQSGTGTKLKLLEAMACGKAVVTTSKGVDGLEVDRDAYIAADDPAQQRDAILGLLEDADRRHRMGVRARNAAEQHDWRRVLRGYVDIYRELR